MVDKDLSMLQLQILNDYYADNAKKLHRVVDRILLKFGGLSSKDKDDFYSLANEVFADVMKRYDCEQSFDGFLYSCLSNKIMSEITKRNCEKRKADRMSISLEVTNDKGEDYSLLDCLASDFDALNNLLSRLTVSLENTKEIRALFNSKHAHIFVAAFKTFTESGHEDNAFGKFLEWFVNGGNQIEVDGKSWETWNENKATRDTNIVRGKIDYLVALFEKYFEEIRKAA